MNPWSPAETASGLEPGTRCWVAVTKECDSWRFVYDAVWNGRGFIYRAPKRSGVHSADDLGITRVDGWRPFDTPPHPHVERQTEGSA